MAKYLTDKCVNAISIKPTPTYGLPGVCQVEGDEDIPLISDFLFQDWTMLRYNIQGVRDRYGSAFDGTGFVYDTDPLEPGDEPCTFVTVFTPRGEIGMSRRAFERLMARFFQAVVEGATQQGHAVTHSPWWPEFVATTEQISERLRSNKQPWWPKFAGVEPVKGWLRLVR